MSEWACPRCHAMLREVVTRNVFTKHAGCGSCGILWIVWGDRVTRCANPTRCAGETWVYMDDWRKAHNVLPTVAPSMRKK
jgi:hypothetical protein